MKYRTTRTEVLKNYRNVISVGYCGLQHLLYGRNSSAYTASNQYGWSSDIYELSGDTVISTGYVPFGNIKPDYDTIRRYNENAREIKLAYSNENARKIKLDELIEDFVNEVVS